MKSLEFVASIAVVAVAFSFENAALTVAILAFLVASITILIVNRRLDEFAQASQNLTARLDEVEQRIPTSPSEG